MIPSERKARSVRRWLGPWALCLVGACRCGASVPERVYEVGVPLGEMPTAVAAGLADLVPKGSPFLLVAERPSDVVKLLRV